MDRLTLLAAARAAGLTLVVAGDRLIVRGPRAAAPLARELLARKAEILVARETPSRASTTRPREELRVPHDAVIFSPPQQGESALPRHRVTAPTVMHILDERGAFNAPEVRARVTAMRERHPLIPGMPLPFLTARDLNTRAGDCQSCGEPIAPLPHGLAVRCQPCVLAAHIIVTGLRSQET